MRFLTNRQLTIVIGSLLLVSTGCDQGLQPPPGGPGTPMPQTHVIEIRVESSEADGIVLTVNPWLQVVRPGDQVEWQLDTTLKGSLRSVDFSLLDEKPDLPNEAKQRPLPDPIDGKNFLRGPFKRHPNDPSSPGHGRLEHYGIQLTIDGQVITLDPDYRVDK